jgi:hypothetical protein
MQPQNRIDTAIAHYKTLRDQPKTVAVADRSGASSSGDSGKSASGSMSTTSKPPSTKSTRTSSGSGGPTTVANSLAPAPAKKSSGPPLTNDQVIQMVKAGLDEDNIIDTIRNAGSVNFDLSVDGQVKLAQNGVKGKILTAMKTKARSSAAH